MKCTLALSTLSLMGAAAGAAQAPRLAVEPISGRIDDPLHVTIEHLLPGSRVKVSAAHPDVHGRVWTAVGEYSVDADGRVDLDTSPSLGGTYEGVSPHGLWCAALPVTPQAQQAYIAELPKHPELGTFPALDVHTAYKVEVSASVDDASIGTATVTRSYGADLATEEVSTPDGLRGVFYLPRSKDPRKVPVVVVAGSGGGVPEAQAALLAARGYPALAQGVFAYKDLPATLHAIPLETFLAGARWLEHRTGAARVAIMGTSRGSEAAGLAASYFPRDFSAAIVYVPSHLSNGAFGPGITDVQPAWTYQGKPIPADRGETDSNNADADLHSKQPPGFIGTPYYLKTWSDAGIADRLGIPFERMSGPVLAIGAGADQMWPSFIGAEGVRRRLAAHGAADRAEVHIYPGAGHMMARVGTGGPFSSFIFHPVAKDFEATGGLPNANCEGSYDAWQKVLSFLARVPAGGAPPK